MEMDMHGHMVSPPQQPLFVQVLRASLYCKPRECGKQEKILSLCMDGIRASAACRDACTTEIREASPSPENICYKALCGPPNAGV